MKQHLTSLSHLTNEQIVEAIMFMIKTDKTYDQIDFSKNSIKAREIGTYIMNLTKQESIEYVISEVQNAGIINYNNEQLQQVFSRLNSESGNTAYTTQLKARYLGIITQYLGLEKVANISSDIAIPDLYIEHNNLGNIFSNLGEIINETFIKLEGHKTNMILKLPYLEQKKALKTEINEKLDFKFRTGTNYLDKALKYQEKKLKYALPTSQFEENNPPINTYPKIFAREDNYLTELFDYMFNESDSKPKVTVSTIYHYFKYANYFASGLTKEKYIQFVRQNYTDISKVFPENYKMTDSIKGTYKTFEKNHITAWKRKYQTEIEIKL